MARPSKPWFRESKGTWYCTMEGRKVSLDIKGRDNEREAVMAWHRLFANGTPGPKPEPRAEAKPEAEAVSVGDVLTAFLADCEGRVKPNTLRVYRYFFSGFQGRHGTLKASALTCPLAEGFARQQADWSDSSRNGFLGALATAFRWAAERSRMIANTPLTGLKRPPKASRGAEAVVSPEEHERLLAHANHWFGLVLRVLWAVGCRPGEAAAITAEAFDEANGVVRLAKHKTAYKGKSRTIFLPPEIVALLQEQKALYGSGHLLRNCWGLPWTEKALVRAMEATRKRAGLDRPVCYGYRHSFATSALAVGVPDAQVAALMGHSGTAMLHRHYSHLTAQAQALKDALGKVRH